MKHYSMKPHIIKPHILKVPYDSGHRCERMARGPGYLLANHFLDGAVVEAIESKLLPEVQCAFDLARQLAVRVKAIHEAGELPVILSGNCNSAMGTVAGLGPLETGILWFDAHGEFHTPETTTSGFFDGMPLAVLTGRCWRHMADSIPGFAPVPPENIILAGVRDTDPEEQAALDASGITALSTIDGVDAALDQIASQVHHWYLHFDLDALDPSEATSNEWVPGNGLRAADIARVVREAARRHPIGAVTFASLDPTCDTDGRALGIARELVHELIGEGVH